MKKLYIEPTTEVVGIHIEQLLSLGSDGKSFSVSKEDASTSTNAGGQEEYNSLSRRTNNWGE